MADAIKQEMSFDASQALATLRKLDDVMKAFNSGVNKSVQALDAFNKKGGKTIAMLKQLHTEAKKAADQMNRVATTKGPTAGKGGSGQAAAGLVGVDNYVRQFEKMFSVSEKATTAQKRMFHSNITNAAEYAAKNKISMAQVMSQAKSLDKTYTGTANKMANHMSKMGNSAVDTAKKWTISWETMVRVVATQAIVRALSIIRTSLKSAVTEAIAFQRAVAEIGTIGREMGGSGAIADTVQTISDAFNVDLAVTAEAAYQTLSNQIASSAQDVESFLAASAKFSKVTKTDLATSVNLLSGTLNAFGKSVSEAEDVAAKFFKTIELGRTRAEELAQGYGTVAPIADKLGISMEELNAAVAALTINGIATDKAFTQIRGTMQAFLKPTTAMIAAMRKAGFATGEQVLAANNLQEAVKRMAAETDGSAAAIAKLFPRIRGLTGVLTLLNDEAGHFNKTMKEQKEGLEETYGTAFGDVMATSAEKITKELNKLKNFFTTEFGQSVLESAVALSQWVGGADNLILVLGSIGNVIPILTGGLLTFGAVMLAVTAKTWAFTAAAKGATAASLTLSGALGVIGIAIAAVVAFDVAFKAMDAHWAKQVAAVSKHAKQIAEIRKKGIDKELRMEKDKVDRLIKMNARASAEIRKEYLETIDKIIKGDTRVVAEAKWALDEILRSREAAVNAILDASTTLDDQIEDTRRSATGLRQDLDDLLFGRKLGGKSESQQFDALLTAAARAAKKASDLMATATTDEDLKAVDVLNKKAMAYNNQAFALDHVSKSESLQSKVNAQARVLTKNRIEDLGDYQQRLEGSKKSLSENARGVSTWLTEAKKMKEGIEDLTSSFDDVGQPLDADTLASNTKAAEAAITDFLKHVQVGVKQFGIDGDDITKEMFKDLALDKNRVEVQTLLAVPKNMQAVTEQIRVAFQAAYEAHPLRAEIQLFATLNGVEIKDMQGLELAETQLTEKLADSSGLSATAQKSAVDFNVQLKLANLQLDDIEKRPEKIFAVPGTDGFVDDQGNIKFNQIVEQMRQLNAEGPLTQETISKLAAAMSEWQQSLGLAEGFLTFGADIKRMEAALLAMQERVNIVAAGAEGGNPFSKWADESDTTVQKGRELIPVLNQTEQKLLEMEATQKSQSMEIQNQVTAYQNLLGAVNAVASAQASIKPAAATAAYHGGVMQHFAAGGLARGQDRIPAMLSAGERVTDAKNSRRFFSQLQSIGAGVQPVYRESGGAVTNIGDVSINIRESSSPKQTAREVMSAIRRESRRGSARL